MSEGKARGATADGAGRQVPTARINSPTRISGTSVHALLASEIGQRIVRGDYPPGTILPNEQQWSQTFDGQPLGGARGDQDADGQEPARLAAEGRQPGRAARALEPARPRRARLVLVLAEPRRLPEDRPGVPPHHRAGSDGAGRRAAQRRADGRDQPGLPRHGHGRTLQERTAADTRFHLAILRASGNELLVPLGVLIESALDQLFVFT